MNTSDIQKILQEQREISPIKGLTPKEINIKLGAESKRKIPVADFESIIYEYWDNKQIRPLGLASIIAERYNVKNSIVEKIIGNAHNTLSDDVYTKLRSAYESKYGRSELAKQMHRESKKNNVVIGTKISQSKQTLTDEQAIEIYQRYLPYKRKHGARAFQEQLAKEYGVSFFKIQHTCLGYHPALDGSRNGVKR